jgi:predicted CXXCH cytochrome family protein
MRSIRQPYTSWAVALTLVFAATAAACVDEKIVYRDAPRFQNPPAAAAGYLGYTDTARKVTACGNCHVEAQGQWVGTAHANAWRTLSQSGHSQTFCEGCHSVNALGNRDTVSRAGWVSTGDSRYKDVQCESCHGAGLSHATSPNDANKPLASIKVDVNLTNGCGECHNGTHHPYLTEWKQSAHGSGAWATTNNRAGCESCHTGQGALAAFGINSTTNYAERAVGTLGPNTERIVCAVCHDPHANAHDGQLRFAVDVANEDQNLCMKCHHKRGVPDLAAQLRGAHSPEGPLLLGAAGWYPPGFTLPGGVNRIETSHGSVANPKYCAGCHMGRATITDPSGNFQFQATGHRFLAIPCVDAQGKPTADQACTTFAERSFADCATSGCHGTQNAARSVLAVAEQRIADLSDELRALLAQVPASEFVQNNIYTVGEGARFNLSIGDKKGSAAHNPFLTEALLAASIRAVRTTYGLAPIRADLSLENTLMKK